MPRKAMQRFDRVWHAALCQRRNHSGCPSEFMRQQPDEGKSECYPKKDLIEFHLFYQPSEKGRNSKSCVQIEHGCAIFNVINIRSSCQPGRIRLRLIGTPFRIKVIDQRGFFARFANKTCAGPVSSPGSRSQLSKEPSHGGKDTGAPEGNRNAWKHGAQSIGARLWQQGRSVEISQIPKEPVADGVRFELTVRCRTPHFECGAIDHSATHP